MVVLAPIRKEPLSRLLSARSSSSADRSAENRMSAWRISAAPSRVGITPLEVRSRRRHPSCSSKSRTPFEIDGWLMDKASAAFEKLPVRTTVANKRKRWRLSGITFLYRPKEKGYYPSWRDRCIIFFSFGGAKCFIESSLPRIKHEKT